MLHDPLTRFQLCLHCPYLGTPLVHSYRALPIGSAWWRVGIRVVSWCRQLAPRAATLFRTSSRTVHPPGAAPTVRWDAISLSPLRHLVRLLVQISCQTRSRLCRPSANKCDRWHFRSRWTVGCSYSTLAEAELKRGRNPAPIFRVKNRNRFSTPIRTCSSSRSIFGSTWSTETVAIGWSSLFSFG